LKLKYDWPHSNFAFKFNLRRYNKAYEARDRAVNEMAKLKAQADKEQQAFEAGAHTPPLFS